MADAKKLNVLVVTGDHIGWFNLSAYSLGVMGYRRAQPSVDKGGR